MITLFALNFIVAVSSFLLVYRIFRFNHSVDSLIAVFLLFFSQIIAGELILGIFAALRPENIILLNLGLFLIILFASRKEGARFNLAPCGKILNALFSDKTVLFISLIILVFGSLKILINLANPPFGWDDLNYHFTFPVEWLKNADLNNPIVIADDPSPTYYPINASLLFFWLIFPLKNVFLADLGQVPFFILAFICVYALARKLGLGVKSSYFSACLFTIIPNYFKQLQIAYVDVMVCALFLACLNYLFVLSKEFSFKNTLIYSAGLGLFLGTKTIALPYSILLVVPFLYLCLRRAKRPLGLLILFLTVVAALGGFSYLRNFFQTGNPLYPLDFKLFGQAVFKGVMDKATYAAHFRKEDYSLAKILFHEGLGVQSLIFILPGIFLALPVALWKRRKALNFSLAYLLILPILIYLAYRYIIPLANARYLYPLLGMGMVLGFYLADNLKIPSPVLKILVIICSLASMGELAKRRELVASINLAFFCFFLILFFRRKIKIKQFFSRPALILIVVLALVSTLLALERWYLKNEFTRYTKMVKYSGFWPDAARAWEWLNANSAGNNIAYIGRPVPFPLYGSGFKNNVYYVSLNSIDPAKLHYFPHSYYHWGYDFESEHQSFEADGNYRSGADYFIWLNNLLRRKTDFLFVYSLHQTKEVKFPIEDRWAIGDPRRFNPVFSNKIVHIYKVLR